MSEERYEIIKLLGKGRTGGVYEAEDTNLGRKVALRRFFAQGRQADLSEYKEDFENVAHSLSALQHPNLLRVYDAGVDQDGAYIISQILKGETLHERIQGEVACTWEVYDMAQQMLDALSTAHKEGFVHGAITPGSILMSPRGRGGYLYVILDMGLSRLAPLIQGKDSILSIMADPAILAPELFDGGIATERADLYMLGQILYMYLAGGHPFGGVSAAESEVLHQKGLPPITEFNKDVPDDFRLWIERLTKFNPSDRPRSAVDALNCLPKVPRPAKAGMAGQPQSPATTPLLIPGQHSAPPATTPLMVGQHAVVPATGPLLGGQHSTVPATAPLVNNQHAVVPGTAVLGSYGQQSTVPATAPLVNNQHAAVPGTAVLGSYGQQAAVPATAPLVNNQHAAVPGTAALGSYGQQQVVPATTPMGGQGYPQAVPAGPQSGVIGHHQSAGAGVVAPPGHGAGGQVGTLALPAKPQGSKTGIIIGLLLVALIGVVIAVLSRAEDDQAEADIAGGGDDSKAEKLTYAEKNAEEQEKVIITEFDGANSIAHNGRLKWVFWADTASKVADGCLINDEDSGSYGGLGLKLAGHENDLYDFGWKLTYKVRPVKGQHYIGFHFDARLNPGWDGDSVSFCLAIENAGDGNVKLTSYDKPGEARSGKSFSLPYKGDDGWHTVVIEQKAEDDSGAYIVFIDGKKAFGDSFAADSDVNSQWVNHLYSGSSRGEEASSWLIKEIKLETH